MPLVACLECGAERSDKAVICPKCGVPVPNNARLGAKLTVLAGIALAGCFAQSGGSALLHYLEIRREYYAAWGQFSTGYPTELRDLTIAGLGIALALAGAITLFLND